MFFKRVNPNLYFFAMYSKSFFLNLLYFLVRSRKKNTEYCLFKNPKKVKVKTITVRFYIHYVGECFTPEFEH